MSNPGKKAKRKHNNNNTGSSAAAAPPRKHLLDQGDEQSEEKSYRHPKLPKTQRDRDTGRRLIVILENASLETVKVGKAYQLLNSTDHANILKKNNRDPINLRPDITHQCLLMLLDSPLNKAGLLQVYIHTAKNVLIEVNPMIRIPRIYSRFAGLMVQLLHDLSISAKGGGAKLLKVIKNPITDHLPTGCKKIGTSFRAPKCVKLPTYVPKVYGKSDSSVAFVVGAVAHGSINDEYVDESIGVSNYAMSAAGVCAKLTDSFEFAWNIH